VGFGGFVGELDRRAGFTLIEIVVVLAILAAIVAVAVPQFSRLYSRVRVAFERDDIERQLSELPEQVRSSGRGGILAAAAPIGRDSGAAAVADLEDWRALRLDLPKGWQMQVPVPVHYHFTGACDGGEVVFSFASLALRYRLAPPLCRPILADAATP